MKRRRSTLGESGPQPGFITQHPTPNSSTYDGQSHQLCTAGTGSEALLYSEDGVSYGYSIPSKINVGTYTVYYKTESSTEYTESDVYQISCTISKATGSASVTARNPDYNRSAQNLVNAGSGTGTIYYRLGTSGSFSTTIPQATNEGTYTVYYYAAASTNYTLSSTYSVTAYICPITMFIDQPGSYAYALKKTGSSNTVTTPFNSSYFPPAKGTNGYAQNTTYYITSSSNLNNTIITANSVFGNTNTTVNSYTYPKVKLGSGTFLNGKYKYPVSVYSGGSLTFTYKSNLSNTIIGFKFPCEGNTLNWNRASSKA